MTKMSVFSEIVNNIQLKLNGHNWEKLFSPCSSNSEMFLGNSKRLEAISIKIDCTADGISDCIKKVGDDKVQTPESESLRAVSAVIEHHQILDLEAVRRNINALNSLAQTIQKSHLARPELSQIEAICMSSRALAANYLSAFLWKVDPPSSHLHDEVESSLDAAAKTVLTVRAPGGLGHDAVVRQYYWNETARLNRTRELRFGLQSFLDRLAGQRKGMEGPPVVTSRPRNLPDRSQHQIQISDRATFLAFGIQRLYVEVSNFLLEVRLEAGPYFSSAKQQRKVAQAIYDRAEAFFRSANVFRVDEKVQGILDDFNRTVVQPLSDARDEASARRVFRILRDDGRTKILNRLSDLYRHSLKGIKIGRVSPPTRPVISSRQDLAQLLAELDDVAEVPRLEAALDRIIETGLSPEDGTLPDSPALAVLRRLGNLAPEQFVAYFDRMLSLTKSPFRAGYFETSLVGVAIANLDGGIEAPLREIVQRQVKHSLASGQPFSDPARIGFLASLSALLILVSTEKKTEAASFLEDHLKRVADKIQFPEHRKMFFQFILEVLKYRISEDNISDYFLQLWQLYRNLEQNVLLWPDTIFNLLKSHFSVDGEGQTIRTAA